MPTIAVDRLVKLATRALRLGASVRAILQVEKEKSLPEEMAKAVLERMTSAFTHYKEVVDSFEHGVKAIAPAVESDRDRISDLRHVVGPLLRDLASERHYGPAQLGAIIKYAADFKAIRRVAEGDVALIKGLGEVDKRAIVEQIFETLTEINKN